MKAKVIAVIPALNEQKHIERVVKDAKRHCVRVIVVDDGSSDRTAEIAQKAGAMVLKSPVNMGKGFALRQGVKKAIGLGAGFVATIDADGQHDARDISRAAKALQESNADIIVGSRTAGKAMPFVKRLGNSAIFNASRILFGNSSIEDTQSGFRVFKADVFKKIEWKSRGYEMESEIVMNIGKNRLKALEMPIKTVYSDKYKGTSVIDGVKIVASMLWWRLSGW